MSEHVTKFDDFAELLQTERAPRPLFILGAAKVDALLAEILTAFLLPKASGGTREDELLQGDCPLSTFSSRIKMCFRLGLIDETLYRTLEKLRTIRNSWAHHITVNWELSPMREHIADLRRMLKERNSFKMTKTRYFEVGQLSPIEEMQCFLLTMCVILEAVRAATVRIEDQSRTKKIASR